MKKTCNGCKASTIDRFEARCDLGFSVDTIFSKLFLIAYEGKPLEECPKPKTNKEFVNLLVNKS
jgi:hypothetical protein